VRTEGSRRPEDVKLTVNDKRRILENFIENDEALGQLLDFISAKNKTKE